MNITPKMAEAAKRAMQITVNSDELAVGIRLRSYGFLVEGCREAGDNPMRRASRQVMFETVGGDDNPFNPLMTAIDAVLAELERGSDSLPA